MNYTIKKFNLKKWNREYFQLPSEQRESYYNFYILPFVKIIHRNKDRIEKNHRTDERKMNFYEFIVSLYELRCHVLIGLTCYHCDEIMGILLRQEKEGYTWGIDSVTMTREQLINGRWQKVELT